MNVKLQLTDIMRSSSECPAEVFISLHVGYNVLFTVWVYQVMCNLKVKHLRGHLRAAGHFDSIQPTAISNFTNQICSILNSIIRIQLYSLENDQKCRDTFEHIPRYRCYIIVGMIIFNYNHE